MGGSAVANAEFQTTGLPSTSARTLLIGLKDGAVDSERLAQAKTGLPKLDQWIAAEKVETMIRLRSRPRGDVLRVRLKSADAARDLFMKLKRLPEIDFVEFDEMRTMTLIPDDPEFSVQRNLQQNSDKDLDAPEAWEMETGEAGLIVAVVDSGVDLDHPDLQQNIWQNPKEVSANGVDDDGNGFIDDIYGWDFIDYYNNGGEDNDPNPEPDSRDNNNDNGCGTLAGNDCVDEGVIHGTHVAGILGAVGNNGKGIAGIAWNIKLMPVRVLSDEGDGFDSDIVAGIDYAVANGADIINLSLGSAEFSQTMADAIEDAFRAGVLVVAAAGNTSTDLNTTPFYPVCNDGTENFVLGVAAIDSSDQQTNFTNYGTNCVDVSAPGSSILSSVYLNTAFGFNDEYGTQSGTSMAAPHVSGIAALLKSFNANLSVEAIRDTIITSADGIGLGVSMGSGRANAFEALGNVDTTVPTGEVLIERNAVGTNQIEVDLTISATTAAPETITGVSFSNDGVTYSAFETYATKREDWDLTDVTYGGNANEGTKTVYVRFKDSGGSISAPTSDSVIYDTTRPSKVQELDAYADVNKRTTFASEQRSNEATPFFEWSGASDSGSGVQGYYVFFGTELDADPVTKGIFQIKENFAPEKLKKSQEKKYFLKVMSVDHAGNRSSTSSVFRYVYDGIVGLPTHVTVVNEETGVRVSWKAPANELVDHYELERAEGEAKTFKALSKNIKKTNFLDDSVQSGHRYQYRLAAADDLQNRSGLTSAKEIQFVDRASIVVGSGAGGGPQIKIFSPDGSLKSQFFAFETSFRGGVSVAAGDLDGDGVNEIVAGRGKGGLPEVRIFDFFGQQKLGKSFNAYAPSFRGGLSVAVGDLNGDSKDEIITGTGPTGGPQIRVFDRNGKPVMTNGFFAYGETFRGGVLVAAGDLNGDGEEEIIAGTGVGGGPQVRVFDGAGDPKITNGFFAYDAAFRGGVRVDAGDLDGDGKEEIITGAGQGGAPQIRTFNGSGQPKVSKGFLAFAEDFDGGLSVAAGDMLQSGRDVIVAGVGSDGSPLIRVMNATGSIIHHSFYAFDPKFTGGIYLSTGNF